MPGTMLLEGRGEGCAEHDAAAAAAAGDDGGGRLEPENPLAFPYQDRCSQTPQVDNRPPSPSGPSSESA